MTNFRDTNNPPKKHQTCTIIRLCHMIFSHSPYLAKKLIMVSVSQFLYKSASCAQQFTAMLWIRSRR